MAIPKTIKMVPIAAFLGTEYSGLDLEGLDHQSFPAALHHCCPLRHQEMMGQIRKWIICKVQCTPKKISVWAFSLCESREFR